MKDDFLQMLLFLRMGVTGKEIELDEKINAEKIYNYAREQGLATVIYGPLSKHADIKKYRNKFITSISNNVKRIEFNAEIIEKFGDINYCYLKGITLARFYNNPETRLSSDTDILIEKKDLKKVLKTLKENGYIIGKRERNAYHIAATHKMGGMIEIHTSLMDKGIKDILFKDITISEPFINVDYKGKLIPTLSVNDGLNYLLMHFIRHFINNGAGIKQIVDITLYMDHYRNELDWDKLKNEWERSGFYNIVREIMGIGNFLFSMEFSDFSNKHTIDILMDCKSGGSFGKKAKHKRFLNDVILEKINDVKRYKKYIRKEKIKKVIRTLTVSKNELYIIGYDEALDGKKGYFKSYRKNIEKKKALISGENEDKMSKAREALMKNTGIIKGDDES